MKTYIPYQMKQFLFLLSLLFLIASCGDDDGGLGRITFIGIPNGWVIASVESDLGAKSSAAVAAVSEEDLSMANTTRGELEQRFQNLTNEETGVDDCDRDDVLFFLENSQMRIIKGMVTCPGAGDPTVLMDFNDNFYSSDLQATRMNVRSPDDVELGVYTIEELDANNFRLSTTKTYSDLLVGSFTYELTYIMRAN